MKNSGIIIVGPGGSGKDHLRKIMESRGYKNGVPYTTRPMRKGETEGIDYYFIDEKKFDSMLENKYFFTFATFREWKYGFTKSQFSENTGCNLFVMSPSHLEKISGSMRNNFLVIYLNPDIEIRRERLSKRNDDDSVERRIKGDISDFRDFDNYDIMITNDNF